jgi:hypothetical protein
LLGINWASLLIAIFYINVSDIHTLPPFYRKQWSLSFFWNTTSFWDLCTAIDSSFELTPGLRRERTHCIRYGAKWIGEHVDFRCLRVDPKSWSCFKKKKDFIVFYKTGVRCEYRLRWCKKSR